jgi:hypothetical protein
MTRIVRTAYRYKRPPKKRKETPALAVEPVVTIREPKQTAKPVSDDRRPTLIVTTISRKEERSDGSPRQRRRCPSRPPTKRPLRGIGP